MLCELPDRDERAQNQSWIHYELECIATFFFGANQKGVSGLLVVLRLICRVRFFIHATNFTRQLLAAMTIIIKFLPHDIATGDTPDRDRNATRKQARAGSTAAAALRVKGSLFVIGNSIESQADATERVPPKISATRCGELG